MDPFVAIITLIIGFVVVISIITYKWFKENQ